jgi:hypothetical protein
VVIISVCLRDIPETPLNKHQLQKNNTRSVTKIFHETEVQFLGTISWRELKLYLKNAFVTEQKKMDGMGAKNKNLSGVVFISREGRLNQHITIKIKAGKWWDYKT